ncbi:hypothetical protein C3B51_19700 [Pseudoalteromonas rubra]|uniref:Uncharacterized protein n=1 Tax=Pseudoalteromonas rubra TaxID=43658 RepID=A0A4V2E1N7_9GAMM|nr:hypothetical protein [Pseudoalteromonas rubra]RZM74672.1 hypothetical protein C3B51_19700 [Pseudoalteromonas rubra]
MVAKTFLSFVLLGLTASQSCAEEANVLPDAFDLIYECGDSDFRGSLQSHHTVLESIEGVEAFLKLKLPVWAFSLVSEVADRSYDKYLRRDVSIDLIESARVYFLETLRLELVNRAKSKGLKVGDCGMEIADILDEINRDKVYLLHHNSFHNFFIRANIPSEVVNNEDASFLLVLMAMPQANAASGVCKTYSQLGARGTSHFTYCN